MGVAYLDASAIVKLVVEEPESEALRAGLADEVEWITAAIAVTEVTRACRVALDLPGNARAATLMARLRDVLDRLALLDLDLGLLREAGEAGPPALRTLDAIHLAAAAALGPDLDRLYTYDRRLADAAGAAGLPVVSPA